MFTMGKAFGWFLVNYVAKALPLNFDCFIAVEKTAEKEG